MTLPVSPRRSDYTGDGTTNTYSFNFKIFLTSDLIVTVRNTLGSETSLTLNTHYTVAGAGSSTGGSISLVNGSFAWLTSGNLTTNYHLTIRGKRPISQTTDIRNQGDYYPDVTEDTFDQLVMLIQQIQDQVDRSIKAAETDYTTALTLPNSASRANGFLSFDGSGNPLIASGISSVPVSVFMAAVVAAATAAAARAAIGIDGASGAIVQGDLAANSVGAAQVQDGTLPGTKLQASSVTTTQMSSSGAIKGQVPQADGAGGVAYGTTGTAGPMAVYLFYNFG